MFDDPEDFGSIFALTELLPMPEECLEDASLAAKRLKLPFDVYNVVDFNPFVYGELGTGPLLGRDVRHLGGQLQTLEGDAFDTLGGIGKVIGHAHGRIVIAIDSDDGYIFVGWCNPDEFEIVHVFEVPSCVQ